MVSASSPDSRRRYLGAVDAVAATRGLGVVLRQGSRMWRLRAQGKSGATVVFELRDHLPLSPFLKKDATAADFRSYHAARAAERPPGWSVMGNGGGGGGAGQPRPAGSPRARNAQVASEWMALGFNCGGAVLSWVGVVGATALLPASAGGSGVAIPFAFAGAMASSAQCGFSVYRTINASRGNVAANKRLDNSRLYVYGMYGADLVGLLGAGGALVEMKSARAVIRTAGTDVATAATGRMNRAVRRELSASLGLQASEAGSHVINQAVRQKLLETVGAAVGVGGSLQSGVLGDLFFHDVVVWITSEGRPSRPGAAAGADALRAGARR